MNDIESIFNSAISFLNSGRFNDAKLAFEEILKKDSNHYPALHILSTLYLQQGLINLAIPLLESALSITPDEPSLNFNLAKAYSELGRDSEAIFFYEKSLRLIPSNLNALLNLSISLQKIGQNITALDVVNRLLDFDSHSIPALTNKSALLNKLGRFEDAANTASLAISLDPKSSEAFINLASAYRSLFKYDDAIIALKNSISNKPNSFDSWFNLALVYMDSEDYVCALNANTTALDINPTSAEAWSHKGLTLMMLNKFDESIYCHDKALTINPASAEAWSHKGLTLMMLNKFDESIYCHDKALEIDNNYSDGLLNKGLAFERNKNFSNAIDCYNQAINHNNNFAEAHWNKSLALLSAGDLDLGFSEFEWRWKRKGSEAYRYKHIDPLKSLDQAIGKRILIWHEQGFGDTIQLCRFIPEIEKTGCKIIFEVQDPLWSLLKNSFPYSQVINKYCSEPVDFQIPIFSLPLLFKSSIASIPNKTPYLFPSEYKLQQIDLRIDFKQKGLNIGLAFSGNKKHKNDFNRSMQISDILPLMDLDANFFVLQKELSKQELSVLDSHKNVLFVGEQLSDFEDAAAIIQNLDVVISVDTAICHLSGALNKKTFIALPFAAEWRWLSDGPKSYWYPQATLFRQISPGSWDTVISEIMQALKEIPKTS